MSDQGPDNWISAELRRVPLPEGLLERLRAIARESDDELDACLRDVPVPAGLVGRLKQVVDDDRLDRQVADVPVPAGLLDELRLLPENESLDAEIRRVPAPMPARVMKTLTDVPLRTLRWRRIWHLATAASLLLTISFSYFLTMLGLIADAYRPPEEDVLAIVFGDDYDLLALAPAVPVVFDLPDEPPAGPLEQEREPSVELIAMRPADTPTVLEQIWDPLTSMADVQLTAWKPLGSPHRADDELPELQFVPELRSGGLVPPLGRGYDRRFLYRHGVHPVVSPSAGDGVAVQIVPLTAVTDSYDRSERVVAQGNMPEADDIRAEEFLAAMEYDLPLPSAGQLAIRTAAGPSVFGGQGAQLLQVAVQAGRPAHRVTQPTYVTVLADVSASMRWGGRLDDTRRALRRFVGHLEKDDRLSLLRFNETAYVDKEYKGPEQADELLTAIDWMRPRGGTNIGAGLQMAASVALRYPTQNGAAPKLVVVSDGVSGLSEDQVVEIEGFIGRLSGQGLQLTVIDLSDGDTQHPLLTRLSLAAGGSILKAQSTEEIQWALVETLTGSSSVVASDAVLEVNFNPRTVAAYRLVGHAPALAGLMPQGAETPLRCRQAATALFELWLRSDADDDVAMAEVTWRDPVSGESRKQRQRISLVQFAPSFAEAPLSLQAATVAAETAEVLGQSHFVAYPTRGLKDVVAVAREVHPRLAERPSFERFVTFVEQAERARLHRGRRGG